jgi:hypothetical protein
MSVAADESEHPLSASDVGATTVGAKSAFGKLDGVDRAESGLEQGISQREAFYLEVQDR